jgi:hypothetical protein
VKYSVGVVPPPPPGLFGSFAGGLLLVLLHDKAIIKTIPKKNNVSLFILI